MQASEWRRERRLSRPKLRAVITSAKLHDGCAASFHLIRDHSPECSRRHAIGAAPTLGQENVLRGSPVARTSGRVQPHGGEFCTKGATPADTLSPVGRGKGEGVSASQLHAQSPLILSFSPPGRRDADPETFKSDPCKSLHPEVRGSAATKPRRARASGVGAVSHEAGVWFEAPDAHARLSHLTTRLLPNLSYQSADISMAKSREVCPGND
jgi:hypothetical protein